MKKRLLLPMLVTGISCVTSFAQPTIKTQKVFGGSDVDVLTSMRQTSDGGFILGGYSASGISGEKTEISRGGNDYWVIKLDSLENIQWDKTIGGSGEDLLYSAQQTSDGGYILGGYSASNISGEKTENSRGDFDYWIVKLDSTGNIQWDKTIGGSLTDIFRCLQQTTDGGYVLGGYSASNISGEKTENRRGNNDYWVVKLDSSGNVKWNKTIGGTGEDELYALQQTSDGAYIIGGYSYSNISGEKTENGRGSADYWVVKLKNNGKIQWDKTFGGNSYDQLQSLQQTSDGGYILGGRSYSNISGEKTENDRGISDYWVVKLNPRGKIQWDKTIGGNNIDQLNSLQQTSDSGYILGGHSYSNISGEKTESSRGNSDYWVVKLKSNGKVQWDKTIGGSDYDTLSSIKEVGQNRYLLGGRSNSGATGDKKRLSRGDYDYWLVELFYQTGTNLDIVTTENITAVTTPEKVSNSFSVYPNPAKDILHIQTIGKATYTVTNQSGKTVLTKTIENSGSINIAQLPAGFYYVKNNNRGEVKKIIIER